ncbi:hypothetical protein [Ruania albidiflava]|uniref:hypothetical protein n=1 Tax=Ruania albidiflava TaxID=366586 RepID=UPI0023F4C405|nr:hypothetical protein [Ruania albidiflava]
MADQRPTDGTRPGVSTGSAAGERPSLRCRVLGHDYAFSTEGATLRWQCIRDCHAGGSKTYRSEAEAARCAAAFNRRDTDDLGRRAPLVGLFPLRLWRKMRRR